MLNFLRNFHLDPASFWIVLLRADRLLVGAQAAQVGDAFSRPFFSLDEVLIPPRLLSPLSQIDLNDPYSFEDAIHPILPYLPNWSELSGQFSTPTLSITEALQSDAHIAIIGTAWQW